MKKKRRILLLGFLSILFLTIYLYFSFFQPHNNDTVSRPKKNSDVKTTPTEVPQVEETNFIFVPYWNVPKNPDGLKEFDTTIYFGISATQYGINMYDEGYKNMSAFIQNSPPDSIRYLALRMLDDNANFAMLQDEKSQQKIVSDAISIAKANGFKGIVLDLELFSVFNKDIPFRIDHFVQYFYSEAKKENMGLFMALYGDTFYRVRPYDVNYLGKNTDGIFIMAYDFHKVRGEPGPNFPLSGKDKYGYDFKQMIDDFTAQVPKEKISVIFGMYGYDWVVDEKKRPIKPAEAMSLLDIEKEFIETCVWKNCSVLRDPLSTENEIAYIDAAYNYHDIWYEDSKSVEAKKEYLKSKGILDTGYWVFGYF